MTLTDLALAIGSFAAGLVIASIVWWLWQRDPEPPAPSLTPAPGGSAPPAAPPPTDGVLRTSQRVVLHLSRQPRLSYGDVASVELTQSGMSRSLSVSQPALARVLRRLLDGDAILEMRTHVQGQSKRLKVYQLTVHGEAIAKDIRAQLGRKAWDEGGVRAPAAEEDERPSSSAIEA